MASRPIAMESNRDQRSGELSVADLRRLLAAAELNADPVGGNGGRLQPVAESPNHPSHVASA